MYRWARLYNAGGLGALGASKAAGPSPELSLTQVSELGRAGITGLEDLRRKALAAVERVARTPRLIKAFFGDPDLHYILNSVALPARVHRGLSVGNFDEQVWGFYVSVVNPVEELQRAL